MALKIGENKKKELVITVSGPITQELIMHVAEYLRYRQLVSKSKATQADVDRLAAEVKHAMGRKHRERLAS
jgi:hypothetical protein